MKQSELLKTIASLTPYCHKKTKMIKKDLMWKAVISMQRM